MRYEDTATVELQTTRGEKLLAFVLLVFLLIGGIWAYDRLDRTRGYEPPAYTASEQAAIDRHEQAQRQLAEAQSTEAQARSELELARERYRTALDAGRDDPQLERAYRQAETDLVAARLAVARAESERRSTLPAWRAAVDRANEEARRERRADERATFALRLAFVLAWLAAAYAVFVRLRRSRWLATAGAAVVAGALLALGMSVDYVEDYVEWRNLGPLALSLAGIVLTLAAFAVLQRSLHRLIPLRRVRKGECPSCGYPARGTHCEGCGRKLEAPCRACDAPRRVGSRHCASCGAA